MKLVHVVEKKGYGPTLGGDIKRLTAMIQKACKVGPRKARSLLSTACEHIEMCCDAQDLNTITARDIVERAQGAHALEQYYRKKA